METSDEVRHQRLLMLLRDECNGSKAQLAKRLDKAYAQVWQWVSRKISDEDGTYRSISSESARYIERKFEKEIGWLDKPVTINEHNAINNAGGSITMPGNDALQSMDINELISFINDLNAQAAIAKARLAKLLLDENNSASGNGAELKKNTG